MKKRTKIFCRNASLLFLVLLLVGCTVNTNEESNAEPSENVSVSQPEETTGDMENNSQATTDDSDSSTGATNGTSENSLEESTDDQSNQTSENKESDPLSNYSSQEIEYARVWLQLGVIKDVDELNVRHIPAGTPLNPTDETSADYPEYVTQLSGSRSVDGSVTYSSNGDGTINVYNVPLRWDGQYPAGEAFYTDMIENTKQVSIHPGDDGEIIELVNKMNLHE